MDGEQIVSNILILDTGKEWGGGTNSLLELLKRIDRKKYRLSVLFYDNCKRGKDSDIKSEIEKLGLDFLLLPQTKQTALIKIIKELGRASLFFSKELKQRFIYFIDYQSRIKRNAKRIADILINQNMDLLYMNNQPSSNLEGILASEMTNVPVLQHSRIETELKPWEVRAANKILSKIICVSAGVKSALVKRGIDPTKCIVVHNGIDPETTPLISSQDIKKRWGISDGDFIIGAVGSLIKRKRINDLIEALPVIIQRAPCPVKCLILGDGPEKASLLKLVKSRKLESSVIFTGFQSDAISYCNIMDIFTMTSEKEGLPRVILEAMLMGKPVIAARISGVEELIENNKTGLLFKKHDTTELAGAVLKMMSDDQLRHNIGRSARVHVMENYSIKKYTDGVQTVIDDVLERNNAK